MSDHSAGCGTARSVIRSATIVEPYMSMIWPGSFTPTLSASENASMVPTATGIPSGRPVARAPWAVMCPATWLEYIRRGSGRPGATSSHHSGIQSRVGGEYIGSHIDAARWSSTYSPVNRNTV